MSSPPNTSDEALAGHVTSQQWKWSALAGVASYLDAGSIVALGAGLAILQKQFGLSDDAVGIIVAIGPNALGCALGALIGGWLGDKFGRKKIYQSDLLVYAFGILLIACCVNKEMLFAGTFIIGLAVGADVPNSLALVGEFAPDKARGTLLGFTQFAWCLGPVVVLWLGLALASLDMLGIRVVFLHLFVVAVVTWTLRRGLPESARWTRASQSGRGTGRNLWQLFQGANFPAIVWTATICLFWNLAVGTAGIFTPHIVDTLHAGGQAMSVGLSSANFVIAMIVTVVIFMRYSDRSYKTRKLIWGVGAIMQTISFGLFLFFPFTVTSVVCNIVLFSASAALSGEAFYKVFSQELFPTRLRGTAQGFTFGITRAILGIWSFFVPILANAGIRQIAALLTLFFAISGIVGYFFMPDTSGKSLEQIERERG